MRRAVAMLGVACWCAVVPVLAADLDARLLQATPSRTGGLVVCRLQTSGLPGAKQLQSMRSGLISAVELQMALIGENDEILAGRSISLRMGFDLWEEVFSVRADGRERRFNSLSDLQTYLADLQGLPVAAASLIDADKRYRLQVGLVVHSIAPDEQRRVEDVIAGEQRPRREGQDQQEASVSMGRLIRMFYKGGGDEQDGQELASAWFVGKELPDETH
ncbi:MAG: hypothetical protein QNL91_05805 [Candidatus Krumholzibacteria bacterium]|nr:hypothetical protein [Candidatus Krumholzibacteria bacterium]